MAALDLKYITKDLNPPNAPKCCPIKKYCSALKQKVWANNWSAKNPEQLIQKIKLCAKKIESSIYQNLFVNLKSKMRCAVKDVLESVASVAWCIASQLGGIPLWKIWVHKHRSSKFLLTWQLHFKWMQYDYNINKFIL